jgi:hypothetical protein
MLGIIFQESKMLQTMIRTAVGFGGLKLQNTLAAGVLLAGVAGVPAAAFAHHHGFHVDVVLPAPVVVAPAPCDAPPGQVWVEPTYQTVCDRQWVAPVYQVVTQRVWVPPVTQTQVQNVDVPAQFGCRDTVCYDFYGRPFVRRQLVQISPAHCEQRTVEVVVTPGHYEDQTRQVLVADGHWAEVQHSELVTPGHYEAVTPVVTVTPPAARLEIPLPF